MNPTLTNVPEEEKLITPAVFNEDQRKKVDPTYVPKKKSFEQKMYAVLVQYRISPADDIESDERTWEIFEGRTAARDFIKEVAPYIDIHETLILTEGVALEKSISAYTFMKHIEGSYDDGFDIEDFNKGDDVEELENEQNVPQYQLEEGIYASDMQQVYTNAEGIDI